jgi:hypothetical protein
MRPSRGRGDEGFALAALICFITAAAILTAIVVPLRVMQSRRETEKELIFRGEEYVRAIKKYQYKYGIYPSSVDDLISRDGYRFIRRQYKDPVNGEDFRLINVNADGSLTGSLTLLSIPVSTTQQNGNVNAFGNTSGSTAPVAGGGGGRTAPGSAVPGGANTTGVGSVSGAGGSLGLGGNGGTSGFSGGGTNTGRPAAGGAGGVGNIGGAFGGGVGNGVGSGGVFGGGTAGNTAPGTLGGAFGSMANPLGTGGTNSQNTNSQNNGATNRNTTGGGGAAPGTAAAPPAAGAPTAIASNGFANGAAAPQISPGIAGVASESTKTSVMIYNEKEKYNEWEFVAPVLQAAANQGANGPNGGANRNGAQGARGPNGAVSGQGVGQIGGQGVGGIGGGGIGGVGNPLGGGGTNRGPAGPGGGTPFGGGGPIAPGGGGAGGAGGGARR